MSSIASQVILHPVASQTLKVLSTTLGRDKIYRAVQYFARFLAWYLIARGYKGEAVRWNALKGHLGTARKLMRLAKPLEHLQAAMRAAQAVERPGEQITTIGRQLGYAGYLIFDSIVWANTVRLITLTPDKSSKVNRVSMRFWLAGILFSIVNGLLKAGRLANESKLLRGSSPWSEKQVGEDADRMTRFLVTERARASVRYQFIIDTLDLWIPAANLGLVEFNDGILGIFGLITSIMALRTQWQAVNKAN